MEELKAKNKLENEWNVWDKTVPVEKSSYLNLEEVKFFNYDSLCVPKDSLTMVDLFCGAGGFSVGCKWSGFEAVLGIDYLEPAMKTWSYNHPNALGCLGDIRNIDPDYIKELLNDKGITRINLITGGVPCQGFSIANRKHNDNDERNFLFKEYMRYVQTFMPDYIILENVSGMRSTAGGKFEEEIKKNMSNLGYKVTVSMVNAADYGVPQNRLRILFVGVKENSGLTDKYKFPKGNFADPKKEITLFNCSLDLKDYRTVYDAISDLPELSNNETKEQYETEPITEYQNIMRGYSLIHSIKPHKLHNHTSPNHPYETIEKIRNTPQGQPMYESFQQRIRLCLDEPSPTQLAGGIRPQFQFGHPLQPRGLSIRERARIQSFPDSYVFFGGTVQERVQTGNAVPPLMIYELSKPIALDINKRYLNK